MKSLYDVIVVGGGIAGQSLSYRLSSLGMKIALLDPFSSQPKLPSTGYSNRVSALTPASHKFLNKIGIWSQVDIQRVQPFLQMKVWEDDHLMALDYEHADSPCLGYIIENANLLQAIDKSQQSSPLSLYKNKMEKLTVHEQLAQIQLDDGKELSARLIVGADGAQSMVRKLTGIYGDGWSYGQKGLVGTLKVKTDQNQTAWQKFFSTGPLALLPLSQDTCSMVWSLPEEVAPNLASADPEFFCDFVNFALRVPQEELSFYFEHLKVGNLPPQNWQQDLKWRLSVRQNETPESILKELPQVIEVQENSRACFPLRYFKATSYFVNRVVLIGDAAHVIHPMAGQGLNLGFGDVECLSQVLENAFETGQDLGSSLFLREYNRRRMIENMKMMGTVDGLWHIFHNENSVLKTLRQNGMSLLNQSTLIKSFISRFAMGI